MIHMMMTRSITCISTDVRGHKNTLIARSLNHQRVGRCHLVENDSHSNENQVELKQQQHDDDDDC